MVWEAEDQRANHSLKAVGGRQSKVSEDFYRPLENLQDGNLQPLPRCQALKKDAPRHEGPLVNDQRGGKKELDPGNKPG